MIFDPSNNRKLRIDWFYQQYANLDISIEQFVQGVNDAYYSQSAKYYSSRYVIDIEEEYKKLVGVLDSHVSLRDFQFVSIGGGQGFEYDTICRLIKLKKIFKIIEPDKAMYNELLTTPAANDATVELHNCFFQEIKDQLKISTPKIIIINSVLHHIINIQSFMEDLKGIMQKGDILLLSHEPNNSCNLFYYRLGWLIKKIKAPLTKGRRQRKNRLSNITRWNLINEKLENNRITRNTVPPIVIRRIIDYGVGYKRDLKKLCIPLMYNEGFWSVKDIKKMLGAEYAKLHYETYRHFGDPDSDKTLIFLNNYIKGLDKVNGTNFISAWLKSK